jgi:hypothetical protein
MRNTTRSRSQAAVIALAPAVFLAVLIAHPPIPGRLPNNAAVAEAVAADTTYWGVVHLTTGVASGLLILAFLAIRGHLREAGEDRYSALGVPFIVLGSTLYALLATMEFTPLAVAETGAATADIAAVQAALTPWFVGTLATAALTFAVGLFSFAKAIADSKVLNTGLTRLVVAALILMAVARFVPFTTAQFYVQGVAAVLALWPFAHRMWRQPEVNPAPVRRTAANADTTRSDSVGHI